VGRGAGTDRNGETPTLDHKHDVKANPVTAGAVGQVPGFTSGEFASGRTGAGVGGSGGGTGTNPGGGSGGPGTGGPGQGGPGGGPGGPDETEVLGLQAVIPGLTTSASAELGGDCTGLELLGVTTVGCAPPPAEGLLTLRTSGILGDNEVSL
jgi:hypothetical protein